MIFWRCPLGTVFLHRVGEYWTDTCELVLNVADFWRWFLQWFGSFSEVSVSIFLHRLEKKERTLSTFSLFSLPIALYLNLFKVSVRYRFPAQAQQKCDLTYTKRHFIPMWFEALLEVSVRVHFHAQARGNWEPKPAPTFVETVFLLTRRCLLGSIFLHQDMENETDTSDKAWFLQIFNNLVSVCVFAEPVQEKCLC